jgi:N-acetylneuraminic acid mutarotase
MSQAKYHISNLELGNSTRETMKKLKMTRIVIAIALMFGAVQPLRAHFLFIVPVPGDPVAQVVFSEDLSNDEDVDIAIVDSSKLFARDAQGKDASVELEKRESKRGVKLPPHRTTVLHGTCEAGVMQRGDSPTFLLVYHPKTILGDAFNKQASLGDKAPAELIPAGKAGALQFQLVAGGKPVADSELTVIMPDGQQKKAKTDANGQTEAFKPIGRYGIWARHFEKASGERDGKKFEQIRHYPTLVVNVTDGTEKPTASTRKKTDHATLAPMPEAASSFGAVASDGWLYVYGGHIVRTHNYSTEAVSRRFHRLNLADGKTWEELPGGPGLQGMNLAACNGKIYRVGGMEPRNKPGEETDNHSIADCVCFDPAKGKWEAIAPLPERRSSHDVAVIGQKLYVIGGWNMTGSEGEEWLSDMLVMDLAAAKPEWKKIEQPFQRRALIAAVDDGKIYVIGGFTEEETPSLDVDIYDTSTGKWSSGPKLPGPAMNGFAPAACTLDGKVYVSVGNGHLYQLNEAGNRWDHVTSNTPRIVHRLAPHESKILVLGGAAKGDNFDLIEVVDVKKL